MNSKKTKSLIDRLTKKYPTVVKSIWMTSSSEDRKGDTIIFLLDDTNQIDSITTNEIKLGAQKLVKSLGLRGETDLIFYKLSDYWELIRHGSPVTFTEIRDGVPLYDPSGFFLPLKKLLLEGRVPGTKEAMKSLIQQSPLRLLRIERVHTISIIDALSSAVVDAAQAPLMSVGVSPPTPKNVPDQLRIHFVRKRKLSPEYVKYYEDVIKTWKKLEHGELKIIRPEKIDELVEKATRFVEKMEELMQRIEK
ncbi:MAG: hypothetical protein HY051_02305 [Candidatus Aenigmarchaeota archaeon]|nr:hypothetical protein [Candidatus Aenigmarchaeota archaeon]